MSAEIELALLVLQTAVSEDLDVRLELEQVAAADQIDAVNNERPGDALITMRQATESDAPIDHFAAAQAFVLGVRHEQHGGEVRGQLRELGTALLEPFGPEEATTSVDRLIDTTARLASGAPLSEELLDDYARSFGPALDVTNSTSSGQADLCGLAAGLATLLIELAMHRPRCRSLSRTVDVRGVPKLVTFVEVDVCTSLPFERCRKGIDPRRWPDCNPYFQSVQIIGPVPPATGSWASAIKEKVGPGLNGRVYETDLAVTYVERPGLAAVAFDLAPVRADDGEVTVDYGFLSASDEAAHRRIRVMKVYRIEDLDVPHQWVCPLWAQQVAFAGWWCP